MLDRKGYTDGSVGDTRMLLASRAEARRRFDADRNLDPQSAECTKALQEAEGVSAILRQNVVQGASAGEGGNFSEQLRSTVKDPY